MTLMHAMVRLIRHDFFTVHPKTHYKLVNVIQYIATYRLTINPSQIACMLRICSVKAMTDVHVLDVLPGDTLAVSPHARLLPCANLVPFHVGGHVG